MATNASEELKVVINSIFKDTGVKDATRSMADFNKKVSMARNVKSFAQAGVLTDQMATGFKDLKGNVISDVDAFNALEKRQKKLTKGFYSINTVMNTLGITFFAMFASRAINNLFKGMMKTFMDVSNKTNPLNIAITRLSANFIFLKYAIIEAATPFLMWIIENLIDFTNWVSEFPEGVLEAIGIGLMALAVALTAAMIAGQISMGLESLGRLMGWGRAGTIAKTAKDTEALKTAMGGNWLTGTAPAIVSLTAFIAFMILFVAFIYVLVKEDLSALKEDFKGILEGFGEADSGKVWKNLGDFSARVIAALGDVGAAILGVVFDLASDINNAVNELLGPFKVLLGPALGPLAFTDTDKKTDWGKQFKDRANLAADELRELADLKSGYTKQSADLVSSIDIFPVEGKNGLINRYTVARNTVDSEGKKLYETITLSKAEYDKAIASGIDFSTFFDKLKTGAETTSEAVKKTTEEVSKGTDVASKKVDELNKKFEELRALKGQDGAVLAETTTTPGSTETITTEQIPPQAFMSPTDLQTINKEIKIMTGLLYGKEGTLYNSFAQVNSILGGSDKQKGLNGLMTETYTTMRIINDTTKLYITQLADSYVAKLGAETSAHNGNASAINNEASALERLNRARSGSTTGSNLSNNSNSGGASVGNKR